MRTEVISGRPFSLGLDLVDFFLLRPSPSLRLPSPSVHHFHSSSHQLAINPSRPQTTHQQCAFPACGAPRLTPLSSSKTVLASTTPTTTTHTGTPAQLTAMVLLATVSAAQSTTLLPRSRSKVQRYGYHSSCRHLASSTVFVCFASQPRRMWLGGAADLVCFFTSFPPAFLTSR